MIRTRETGRTEVRNEIRFAYDIPFGDDIRQSCMIYAWRRMIRTKEIMSDHEENCGKERNAARYGEILHDGCGSASQPVQDDIVKFRNEKSLLKKQRSIKYNSYYSFFSIQPSVFSS